MTSSIFRRFAGFALILAFGAAGGQAHAQATLETVRERGELVCGVNPGLAGFSTVDAQGRWTGFDVAYCRAIAAAIFGDPERVRFEPLSARERFSALREGDIDVLLRNSTATMERDVALELDFPAITYFDGQGFLVRKDLGVSSARELNGATVCVENGTTTRLNLDDFFRQNGIRYEPVVFDSAIETIDAYLNGRCDAYTTDASGLYAQRLRAADPDNHVVLPEVISKEPLGPAVRHGDSHWADLVRWVHFAMLNAEEHGVTSQNVDDRRANDPAPVVRRLLGVEGDFGRMLGLDEDWAYNVIKHVGNYGEVYARNIGEGSPLRIQRGLNALWTRGGLQYGHPIR
ncbi:MAG: amino acid ABC transporter substrate-binding protein [Salinarimonadaceae bacterium]|nr:MAG: amino acid ABC transporter substrate-binding protein [Salinarimonadaceae bacterium]